MGKRDVNILINAKDNTGPAFRSANAGMGALTGNLLKLGLAYKAMQGLVGGASWVVRLTAQAETANVAFRVLLGSQSKATKMIGDLTKFAAETPFGLQESQDAARGLIAFGIEQEKVLVTMRRIGDVAAATGQPFNDLARVYGTIRAQGRMFAQDINQFTGRGIPIIAELAKQFGVAESEVKNLVKNGQIGFEQLEKAFASMTENGGRFQGLMAEQSKTLAGQFAKLKDDVDQIGRELGKTWLPALKQIVIEANSFAKFMAMIMGMDTTNEVGQAAQEQLGKWGVTAHSRQGKITTNPLTRHADLTRQLEEAKSLQLTLEKEKNRLDQGVANTPQLQKEKAFVSQQIRMVERRVHSIRALRGTFSGNDGPLAGEQLFNMARRKVSGAMSAAAPTLTNIRQIGGNAGTAIAKAMINDFPKKMLEINRKGAMQFLFPGQKMAEQEEKKLLKVQKAKDRAEEKKLKIEARDEKRSNKLFSQQTSLEAVESRFLTRGRNVDPAVQAQQKANEWLAKANKKIEDTNRLLEKLLTGAATTIDLVGV